ncbi:hypothetical protein SAY87_018590 [Trapa incisa]|uniref:Homeobox-leucine zipper protein n=1 Tax=Trapa incisa TaxID=236973 RepID=A0AAN7L8S1_9MYRT|nr:hypothetical protein SAY87_018590 [Trapa incisa]
MAFPPAGGNFMFHHHLDQHQYHHLQDHYGLPSSASLTSSLSNVPSPPFTGHNDVPPYMMRRSMSFTGIDHLHHHHQKCDEGGGAGGGGEDDLSDDGSQLGEKKKRLTIDQVKALEKSFELGNKLDPERKLQLARALGLQPRQIAIWFQNRRARWKTKQLERDYEVLKKQFDALKADNETLQIQNEKLHGELLALKRRNTAETPNSNWSCDNSSEIKLDLSGASVMSSPASKHAPARPPSLPRPDPQHYIRVDHHHPTVQEEGQQLICSMFNGGGVDDHQNFWPAWGTAATTEQHRFH